MWLKLCFMLLLHKTFLQGLLEDTFDAIKDIHSHVDDDNDGHIDQTETLDYVKTELDSPGDDVSRQSSFHRQSSQISVNDLWEKWKSNEVHQWNKEQVIIWLIKCVQLPQYEAKFREINVDGKNMPRLATPKTRFLQDTLKITNPTHRKKIYLRASDAVLFGPPDSMKRPSSKEAIKKNPLIDHNFEAIKAVHAHLDDDNNGDIDVTESHGYMKEELLDVNADDKRHLSFHSSDDLISVDDLWYSWQKSEVYNWTTDQVVHWLKTTVGLPEYENNFRKKNIDGRSIPRLAIEKSPYLQQELEVTNPKHRRKIYLRASDIILFGSPEVSHSHLNDTIVVVVILLSTVMCLYAFREKRLTHQMVENMTKDMEALQQAELKLAEMQDKFGDEERPVHENLEREQKLLEEIDAAKKEATRLQCERSKNQEGKMKLALVEQELSEVRLALAKAETEMRGRKVKAPQALQHLLQLTYNKEVQYFQFKKQKALKQMQEAKEACDKVGKTRRSMFGSLRLAHGQSIDSVDHKILDAKSALAEVTNDLQERQNRWWQIEELLNFPILVESIIASVNKEVDNPSEIRNSPHTVHKNIDTEAMHRSNSSTSSIRRNELSSQSVRKTEFYSEPDQTDPEVESLPTQQAQNRFHDSPLSIKRKRWSKLSNESNGSLQDIRSSTDSKNSAVGFDISPRSDSFTKAVEITRSTSEKARPRPVERYIVRAQTHPSELSRLAHSQGKNTCPSVISTALNYGSTGDISMKNVTDEYSRTNSKNDEDISNDTVDSDQEGLADLADESSRTSSMISNSSLKKKPRKPFSKLFARKSTKSQF